jgi:hypothetical protein
MLCLENVMEVKGLQCYAAMTNIKLEKPPKFYIILYSILQIVKNAFVYRRAAWDSLWEERSISLSGRHAIANYVCTAYAKNKQVAHMNGKRDQ